MKGFTPFDDLVVILRDDPEAVSKGGIIIPTIAQEELEQGTIVAHGPGKRSEVGTILPMEIKEGDKVLFSKYANLKFVMDGVEYLTMREGDLIGVVDA